MEILFQRLRKGAVLPSRSHKGDAGWDLSVPSPLENYKLFSADNRVVPVEFSRTDVHEVSDLLGLESPVVIPTVMIPSGYRALVPLGFSVALPEESEDGWGWELQFRPRSGSALKQGLTLANAVGTVDSSYRGECGVILLNTSESEIELAPGDRIGQAVLSRYYIQEYREVAALPDTVRNQGGFGSTGV